jgi:hypothetical protein
MTNALFLHLNFLLMVSVQLKSLMVMYLITLGLLLVVLWGMILKIGYGYQLEI